MNLATKKQKRTAKDLETKSKHFKNFLVCTEVQSYSQEGKVRKQKEFSKTVTLKFKTCNHEDKSRSSLSPTLLFSSSLSPTLLFN
jgi:hypothetical protein